MGLSILYLCSFFALWLTCLLYPKTEKINFISGTMMGYVTVLCYGAFGAFALKLCHVPINLQSMSYIYLFAAIIVSAGIFRKHRIQRLTFEIFDFVMLVVALCVFGRLAVHIFSRHININYLNMVDPGRHFQMAMEVVREEKISGMYFAPLHNAMFISVLSPFVPETWCYKLFILSDCFHNLMELYFFYGFMLYVGKGCRHKWMPALVTALYWCGYPLYSFARGGYVYWAMGAMLVQYVIFVLHLYENNNKLRKLCILLLSLGCFGVTVCYIEFAPAIVISVMAVITYYLFKEKKIVFDKKLMFGIVATVIIVCICASVGYYFVFYSRDVSIFQALSGGKNTSKNWEIIVSIPILYCIVYNQIREKKLNAYSFALVSFLGIQFCFTVLAAVNRVSTYYLFKPFYIFWSLIWIILYNERDRFVGKFKKYTLNYLIAVAVVTMFVYVPQQELETTEACSLDNSIWRHNALVVQKNFRDPYLSTAKVELMEYICNEWDEEETVVSLLATNTLKGISAWYEGITNQPAYWLSPLTQEDIESYLKESDTEYVLVFTDSEAYECNAEYLDSFEKVYSNTEGFIAKVH